MYPDSLIPKVSYVTSIEVSCLLAQNDFYVIRRVDLPFNEFYDEEAEIVYPTAFNFKELPGLSLNLLCLKSDATSTNWRAKGKAIDSWDGSEVLIDDYDYDFNDNHSNGYFKIKDLHNLQFPIEHSSDRGTRNELRKKGVSPITEKQKENEIILESTGMFELVHKPNFINYWHFELKVIAENVTLKKGSKNKAVNKALELFIDQILTGLCYVANIPTELKDPEVCYLRH